MAAKKQLSNGPIDERAFWFLVKRALLMFVSAIEQRYGC
jgi:hypothetical protein